MKLTADLVEAFAGTFLSPRYDNPQPTPPFHREAWKLYCSDAPNALVIAPRNHAKSTGLTFDYGLAETLFRVSDYVILIGSTEDKAAEQLSNISEELHENVPLIREFGVKDFDSDTKTEIIVRMQDNWRFRILARGAEQKIRGSLWKGKRPNLILCDDMEDDEQVESRDRRRKFRRWFFRAAVQALSTSGKIRVHGTILHEDSLLNRLRRQRSWQHLYYKAHAGFDDFSNILWPEQWPEEKLRAKRQEFIDDGDSAGYSQEFLNDPQDDSEAYIRRDDFIPMTEGDLESWKTIHAAADFAVSKADQANRTSFTIGGKDVKNLVHFIDFRVGRWDPVEWIEEMFAIQKIYSPEVFWVEDGVIWKAIKKFVFDEMLARDVFINIEEVPSIKDKATRGTSLRKRMRARGTRWNTLASGYEDAKEEILRFRPESQGRLDDQFDSASLLSLGFDRAANVEEEDAVPEEDWEMRRQDPRRVVGRSTVTGY